MPYQEETIKTIVDRLNTQYFLPAIQRRYVWRPDQVILLWDSIMRRYPISSFLFWEIEAKNRDKWEIYRFADQPHSDGTTHAKLPVADGISNLTLVLDGQQRLTSILVGLKGIFHIRARYQRYARPHRLYLDLFEDPTPRDEDLEYTGRAYYGFRFFHTDNPPTNSVDHHWFRISRILNCENEDDFYEMREEEEASFLAGVTKASENLFERNVGRLYDAIWRDHAISYYVERDQDHDRVLDIFTRANEAGTELTKAQILLSMFTSKWTKYKGRDEIDGFLHQLNKDLDRRNNFSLEFIMRACLVLAELPVRYRINNFTNSSIARIEDSWSAIRHAVKTTVKLVNSFGLDRKNLTSANALIPLVYYIYQHQRQRPDEDFLGSTPFAVRNARLMRQWLFLALLNRVFGRGVEQLLANTRRVIKESAKTPDFPYDALNAELVRMGYPAGADEGSIQRFLEIKYPQAFLPLTLLYSDYLWGITTHQQDHIFPKSRFSVEDPVFRTLSPERQRDYLEMRDRLANLELLDEQENREKLAKPFDEWIQSRDNSFSRRHIIPQQPELYAFECFEEFIAEREHLLAQRLRETLAIPNVENSGL